MIYESQHMVIFYLSLRISESTEWVTEYHQSRPGLKELQQRIDQFMVEHDEKLEQVIFLFDATITMQLEYLHSNQRLEPSLLITLLSLS